MPLKKLLLKPGVNRENTRYTNENGWYECDKIRFRQGTPEKIGGWQRNSAATFLGWCRSLWNWVTLVGENLIGVGTEIKFYIQRGGAYFDITPIRETAVLTDPFSTTIGSEFVTVTDVAHGATTGSFVTFSGASTVGGLDLNHEYSVVVTGVDTYSINAGTPATSTVGAGGGTVTARYQLNIGSSFVVPQLGWGAGPWGYGAWGEGIPSSESLRLWSQTNFGEDLIFGPRGGAIYYWDASAGLSTRAVELSTLLGASAVPLQQNYILVSDVSRFVFVLGCNDYLDTAFDPMLIRWSDQEDPTNWAPAATNQAGSLRVSRGSQIITGIQSRQEVLVWTDSALYSLQYVGAPVVWGAQLVGDNLSIVGQNAVAYANGVSYWMGKDKFYKYDGRTQTLNCDLRKFIFEDINLTQEAQFFAGTNEGFNEIWWFYCSSNSSVIDKYVVYNYAENIWYYGTMGRTAWLDSGVLGYPIAATFASNIVNHEQGVDDNVLGTPLPITSYIASAEFDLDDGHQFSFVWRVLPDITFSGSQTENPSVTMYLLPLKNSGSGYNVPDTAANQSVGGVSFKPVTRTAVLPIEQFTGQIFTRVRGRQLIIKVESTDLGVNWQLGAPRIDIRPDGRR
jgi:hypothetical protein